MAEFVVFTCALAAIILVILGVRNRRRLGERENHLQSIEALYPKSGSSFNASDKEQFEAELSKCGFTKETIEDMYHKVLDKKGYVSSSDAVAIVQALSPIMNVNSHSGY